MTELEITKDFTIDDIHKIREYNYEHIKKSTTGGTGCLLQKQGRGIPKRVRNNTQNLYIPKSVDYPHTSLKNRRSPHPGGSPSRS